MHLGIMLLMVLAGLAVWTEVQEAESAAIMRCC
jgi:hypothetical protein